MRKLQNRSGEALVEALAALLIVTLASLLFLQMTLASVKIGDAAREADSAFLETLNAAELSSETRGGGRVELSGGSGRSYGWEVTFYGNSDALVSYAKEASS